MFELYRTALVTGATSGIGKAIVGMLRQKGLVVYAVGRNKDRLDSLSREYGSHTLCVDVRDTVQLRNLLTGIDVDILVNNAGILSTRALFQETNPAEIDAMIDINLKAPLHLTRMVLPKMMERGHGHLIYIGSSAGRNPYPNMSVYGPSKAGISLFCDNLRCDLLGTNIRVSEIAPGRVQTRLYNGAIPETEVQALLYDDYRALQPENIAQIVNDVIALPAHVDVTRIEVLPTDQIMGGTAMVKSRTIPDS